MADDKDVTGLRSRSTKARPLPVANVGYQSVQAVRDVTGASRFCQLWTGTEATRRGNALPARAAISPDVPAGCESFLLPSRADFGRGYALVVAVVPFADVLGDLDLSVTGQAGGILDPVGSPRQRLAQTEIE